MSRSNFCANCGARLMRKDWRDRMRGAVCDDCASRLGPGRRTKLITAIALVAAGAFAFGRYVRPKPPPLIIERAANSPLSDAPINRGANVAGNNTNSNQNVAVASSDDTVYICGARTRKGTPCRRRVHFAGQRCFQHKGMPAMVPLEKLTIKP